MMNKKRAGDWPARRSLGIELYANTYAKLLGPIRSKPRGAGGLRNPVLENRPGPEATVFRIAIQRGGRLFEKGQYYVFINESVNGAAQYVAASTG
jgi:hypothetical protein